MTIRDGQPNFVVESFPRNYVPYTSTTKVFVGRVREKLKVVREKGYTTCDPEVKSLTQLFPIAKYCRRGTDGL